MEQTKQPQRTKESSLSELKITTNGRICIEYKCGFHCRACQLSNCTAPERGCLCHLREQLPRQVLPSHCPLPSWVVHKSSQTSSALPSIFLPPNDEDSVEIIQVGWSRPLFNKDLNFGYISPSAGVRWERNGRKAICNKKSPSLIVPP